MCFPFLFEGVSCELVYLFLFLVFFIFSIQYLWGSFIFYSLCLMKLLNDSHRGEKFHISLKHIYECYFYQVKLKCSSSQRERERESDHLERQRGRRSKIVLAPIVEEECLCSFCSFHVQKPKLGNLCQQRTKIWSTKGPI